MAILSDLPNELIIGIWCYVIEPDDVESFAMVSKRIHDLSSPFVNEHAILKQQYSRICFFDGQGNCEPADLLEKMLLDTRIAFYINNLGLSGWRPQGKEHTTPQVHTMALFEGAIRASPLIPSSEAEDWIRDIEQGQQYPIIALVIMRLTRIKEFALCYEDRDYSGYLLGTLKRIAQSSEVAIETRQSIPGTEISGDTQIPSTRPSMFSNTSDVKIHNSYITLDTISQLLRCTKHLKSFTFQSFYGSSFDTPRLCDKLVECSQLSLQKLSINSDDNGDTGLGDITQFQMLAEVEVDIEILLGDPYGICKDLADVLPVSIESVTILTTRKSIPNHILRRVILDVIKCKMERLPKLQDLTFNFGIHCDDAIIENMVLITELEDMSAKVGVLLSADGEWT